MVVGKKTSSKSKKHSKIPQSSTQHQQNTTDCLKDDVSNLASSVVSRELHENAIELGYNSGDEYDRSNACNYSAKEIDEMEKRFEKKMRKKGFIIKKMAEDGACLFRAVADQIYGDQEMHSTLRKLCMDYMSKNADYFSHYVTEDFTEYIKRKRLNSCHGNHVEIQAMSEMFNRPIEVYHYNCEPINIFQGCNQDENEPIRLSYHQNVHYNSVVDPYKATVGIGLGFPSFKPGLADKTLLEKAMRISEEQELEQVMLQDKMKMSEWEATNEAIEEQIARESYVEWLKENEHKLSKNKKVKSTATATTTTSSTNNNNEQNKSPRLSPKLSQSPKAGSSGLNSSNNHSYNNNNFIETGTFVNQFPPTMFGMSDWAMDDGDILRQVLAQSQQEYLDSLKRKAKEINTESSSSSNQASSSGYCNNNNNTNNNNNESYASCSTSSSPNRKQKVVDNNEVNKCTEQQQSDQVDKKNEDIKSNEIINDDQKKKEEKVNQLNNQIKEEKEKKVKEIVNEQEDNK